MGCEKGANGIGIERYHEAYNHLNFRGPVFFGEIKVAQEGE